MFFRNYLSLLCLSGVLLVSCGQGSDVQDGGGSGTQDISASDPIAAGLLARYKVLPYSNAGFYLHEWEEYARCLPAEARGIFHRVAGQLGLNVYDFYTVAMGEGLGFHFDHIQSAQDLLDAPVDGFAWLGVDFFLSELPGLIQAGLLPADFRAGVAFDTQIVERNEPGDNGVPITLTVPVFRNFNAAVMGFGAVYAARVRRAQAFARTSGLGTLDQDQTSFWGYFFYQNPGLAQSSMRNNGISVFTSQPDSIRPKDIRTKSIKRVVTARYLAAYEVLEQSAFCRVGIWTQ
jgi:hypothetical protein